MTGQELYLTNVYGRCTRDDKVNFINWLYNYDCSALDLWLVMGDFNLIRCPENINRPGGNVNELLLFNDVISHLDLVEVPLKNKVFTWSNMQSNCLLEKLDWIFTSSGWTLSFPNTLAYAISHATSDHVPYVTQMDSMVAKLNIFRFENFWASLPDFLPMVKIFWDLPHGQADASLTISAKFKALRRGLKAWGQGDF
jgi:hypothetical protein